MLRRRAGGVRGDAPVVSLIVAAIGGNALKTEEGTGAASEWFDALAQSLPPLIDLLAAGHRLVLTHGNGPQAPFAAVSTWWPSATRKSMIFTPRKVAFS